MHWNEHFPNTKHLSKYLIPIMSVLCMQIGFPSKTLEQRKDSE